MFFKIKQFYEMSSRNAKGQIVSLYQVSYPHIKTCYENFHDLSVKILMLSKITETFLCLTAFCWSTVYLVSDFCSIQWIVLWAWTE